MAPGRLVLAATLGLSTFVVFPPISRADDSPASESDASKHVFQGEVNANAVIVRSRPSEDGTATMKLKKGDKVTVVGIHNQWLKIEPPEGSFAYVGKSNVLLRGDGTVGRATRDTLAHAGSDLNEIVFGTMATVHQGEDLQIIGQYNEYFKIKPPADSYVYVNKQFVDPVKTIQPAAKIAILDPPLPQLQGQQPPTTSGTSANSGPTTQPNETIVKANPTTQPAGPDAIAAYQKLEEQFDAAGKEQLEKQPLSQMLAGYEKVIAADDLPSSMRSIAEMRVAVIKSRAETRDKLVAMEENQKKIAAQQQSMVAERQEIEERIKKNDVQVYAAVGTLRPSSLQIGQGMLYRLTDPATGRTACYLRTNDSKYGNYLGQFIGVRGKIEPDPQLHSIIENPLEAVPVDQAQVNGSIAAQIVPPSLMHNVPQSSSSAAPVPSAIPASATGIGRTDQASTASEPQ